MNRTLQIMNTTKSIAGVKMQKKLNKINSKLSKVLAEDWPCPYDP